MNKMAIRFLPHIDKMWFSSKEWGITFNYTGWADTHLNDRFRDLVNAGLTPITVRQTIMDIVKEMEKMEVAKFDHDVLKPFLESLLEKAYGGRTQ